MLYPIGCMCGIFVPMLISAPVVRFDLQGLHTLYKMCTMPSGDSISLHAVVKSDSK